MTYGASSKPIGSRLEVMQWFYFRFSGMLLVFLAFFHLWLNHIKTEVGDLNYNLVITRLNEYPVLRVADFLLLFLGLSHGLLGIKNIIDDRASNQKQRMLWLGLLSIVFTVFLIAGTAVLWTLDASGGN